MQDVRGDIESCFAAGREVTREEVDATAWHRRLLQILFRFFAPLM